MNRVLDILVVAPHPDDAELGMGGSIMRFLSEGLRVGVLDLTNGEPTPHGTPEIRAAETAAATEVLGLTWRENLGLPNRSLEPTLEARHKLASVIRRTRPRWLFAPYWEDAHPDHLAATQLVDAARFWAKLTKSDLPGEPHHPERIFNYYCVHLRLALQPAFVMDVSPFWERKLTALKCYHSQLVMGREHMNPPLMDQLHHEAGYWGRIINRPYGEPFTCREPLALNSMTHVI